MLDISPITPILSESISSLSVKDVEPTTVPNAKEEMMTRVATGTGFIAALDQCRGSNALTSVRDTLQIYGAPDEVFQDEEAMNDKIHDMRARIMSSETFTGDKIFGAILFEDTLNRQVQGLPTARYLWEHKKIVPFLHADEGLAPEENGVQLMNPMTRLDDLIKVGKEKGVFGTKMRSLIKHANEEGIKALVDQQFDLAKIILAQGLVPIIEPQVDIKSFEKVQCEDFLKANLLVQLDQLGENEFVMLKLSLPSKRNHYQECIEHPNVLRVGALSGGYARTPANVLLSKQTGMVASFSRALYEGLHHDQDEEDFDMTLKVVIHSIFKASISG
jgi:fructose-bisphosphate aldolase class I